MTPLPCLYPNVSDRDDILLVGSVSLSLHLYRKRFLLLLLTAALCSFAPAWALRGSGNLSSGHNITAPRQRGGFFPRTADCPLADLETLSSYLQLTSYLGVSALPEKVFVQGAGLWYWLLLHMFSFPHSLILQELVWRFMCLSYCSAKRVSVSLYRFNLVAHVYRIIVKMFLRLRKPGLPSYKHWSSLRY